MNEEIANYIRTQILLRTDPGHDIGDDELSDLINRILIEIKSKYIINVIDRMNIAAFLMNDIKKLGILQELLEDDTITEVMVNGYNNIFYERSGHILKWDKQFESKEKLCDIVQRIAAKSNKIINESVPIADTRLGDGSRVNIVLNPVAIDGPVVTIRKFYNTPLSMDRMIELNSITGEAADFLKELVENKYNIFISGGTGSGKTTFLNALSNYIPSDERIITIEDSAELQLSGTDNLVRLEARNANIEGKNEKLSNGDKVSYTWKVDKDAIAKLIKCKIKYSDGSKKVSGLKEMELFDPFKNLKVTFSGVEPNGEADIEYNGDMLSEYDFTCDKTSGLKNGDKIKISLTEDAGYYVDQYNKAPSVLEKEYKVKNLGKYLSKIKEVDTDGMNSARAKAQKSISDMVDYWSEDVTLDKVSYAGDYLQVAKDSDDYTKNYYGVIYQINAHIQPDGGQRKDVVSYYSMKFENVIVGGDGKCEIDLDEYDVPLAKASSNGYYKEMLDVMKTIMSTSLKDNSHLQFAVVTGCLKIAKESIFTGTNNFISDTIIATHLNEYFGFTDQEVKDILKDIGLQEHFKEIKEWYDGYNFGKIDVYCPWDVMNYVRDLRIDPDMKPASYWKNTSDNAIIRSFIDYAGSGIQKKMEKLMAGDTIDQKIEENLTYDYLHSSEENFWSILYLTGYLTRDKEEKESADGKITLKIPNKEIREIFETTVQDWFSDTAKLQDRKHLFDAVWNGDEQTLTQEISRLLRITISYHDYREDFYHAFLAGIFAGAGYSVESNKEHGEGRSDLVIFNEYEGKVAVFEAKYSKEVKKLEEDCEKAIQQIDHRMYAKEFEDSYDEVICYGISFYKKRCVVKRDVK